jgi:hypothetical protein
LPLAIHALGDLLKNFPNAVSTFIATSRELPLVCGLLTRPEFFYETDWIPVFQLFDGG